MGSKQSTQAARVHLRMSGRAGFRVLKGTAMPSRITCSPRGGLNRKQMPPFSPPPAERRSTPCDPCPCVCNVRHLQGCKLAPLPKPPSPQPAHLPHIGPTHALHAGAAAAGLATGQLNEYLAGPHVGPVTPNKAAWRGGARGVFVQLDGAAECMQELDVACTILHFDSTHSAHFHTYLAHR